jgi:FkbM family methyltransferase
LGYTVEKSTIQGSKFIYASKIRKNYWLNKKEQVKLYNLHDFSKDFTWDTMRAGLHDGNNHMYKEMHFTHNEYTNGCVYERLGCVIEKGDVVVDIGANVGVFSNAAYYKGASKVYSFEPTDAAYTCLIKNKPVNCQTFKMGVGDKEGFAKISVDSTDNTMCATFTKEDSITEFVPMTTLDALFSKGLFDRIDFLKIDAEGYEKNILEGLSDSNLSKVRKIALEFHSNLLSDEVSQSIIDRMYKNGFKSFQLFIDDGVMRIYNFWK